MSVVEEALAEATQQVVGGLSVDSLVAGLAALPDEIAVAKSRLADKRALVEDAESALKEVEALLTASIAAEVKADGKPLFSNAEARQAEFIRRASREPSYKSAVIGVREARKGLDAAQIECQRLEDSFKATRSAAEVMSALLHAVGH